MKKFKTINFYHGELRFSAGHFTIFSATHREKLHGHNYSLEVSITTQINEPGITYDYAIFSQFLLKFCNSLHLHFLLPGKSPYLKIEEKNDYYHAYFNGKNIPFPKEDVIILPL